MTDLVEQLRAQAVELRQRAVHYESNSQGTWLNSDPGWVFAGQRRTFAAQSRSLADLIDGSLTEHWQTKQPWEGGTVLIDACGRCRYGDGVCYPSPCRSLRFLAAHVSSVIGEVTA